MGWLLSWSSGSLQPEVYVLLKPHPSGGEDQLSGAAQVALHGTDPVNPTPAASPTMAMHVGWLPILEYSRSFLPARAPQGSVPDPTPPPRVVSHVGPLSTLLCASSPPGSPSAAQNRRPLRTMVVGPAPAPAPPWPRPGSHPAPLGPPSAPPSAPPPALRPRPWFPPLLAPPSAPPLAPARPDTRAGALGQTAGSFCAILRTALSF